MTNFILKIIDDSDRTEDFNCGDEDINFFLKNLALSNQNKKFSNTFIFYNEKTKRVVAYFSILASQLNTGDARIYGVDKIPVALLGRIGVDKEFRGKNIGKLMIRQALTKALKASKSIACRLLLVETSLDLKSYYLDKVKLGFEWFKDSKKFTILVIDLFKFQNTLDYEVK